MVVKEKWMKLHSSVKSFLGGCDSSTGYAASCDVDVAGGGIDVDVVPSNGDGDGVDNDDAVGDTAVGDNEGGNVDGDIVCGGDIGVKDVEFETGTYLSIATSTFLSISVEAVDLVSCDAASGTSSADVFSGSDVARYFSLILAEE
eukprot:13835234-Ditylum_brightwellii.AAC.1